MKPGLDNQSEHFLGLGQGEDCFEGELLLEATPAEAFVVPPYIEAEYVEAEPVSEASALRLFHRPELGAISNEVKTALHRLNGAEIPALLALPAASEAQEKYVIFSLAGANYAVPMNQVLELGELEHFTPVPHVPAWLLGVTNLRGDIVSVIDLRVLLGLDATAVPANNLLVAETLAGDLVTCLLVERVQEMASVPASKIQTLDGLQGASLTPYSRGVYKQGDRLLSILDLEGLLRSLTLTP
jgi:purine-binding chemotaxis protein CheW